MPTLELDVTADATKAAASLDAVGSSARGMASDVSAAASSADSAVAGMDGLAGSADQLDSKASQATGAIGALAGGLEAAGFEGAGAALQGVAIATDTLSGAGGLLNLVLETQAAQWVIAKAQMVASTVASGAQATATGVATGAQWLWNAALSANPIGLVVAGVALLVGGLVLAYQKVEPFRDVVDKGMGVAKDAVDAVWGAIQTMGEWVGKADDGWDKIRSTAEDALGPVTTAVGAVSDALENAVGWVQSLIDWIGKIDFPSIDLPGFGRTVTDTGTGLTKEEFLQQLAMEGWLASSIQVSVTAEEQDKDKAMRTLVDALREYFARQGMTLSVTT